MFTSCVIPTQLGRTDPFLRLSTRSDLDFFRKALSPVKQESPFYRQAAEWRDLPGVQLRVFHVVLSNAR